MSRTPLDPGGNFIPALPVPKSPSLYGWYFRNFPTEIPTDDCVSHAGFHLLYVGISPSALPGNGKPPSRQSLQHRVRHHMAGNAEGSTLRLSLGCLLEEERGIQLRRVGSGNRLTFSSGEQWLSEWIHENARVVWNVCDEPWELEKRLISTLHLPLNLDQNRVNPFCAVLSRARRDARIRAKDLPVLPR